uniref:Cation efflux family protein n=1 Tax=uncultured bacterium Contigcl_24 TaxID=1393668 RepID=W0FL46_9BACT|nr:cation efflux family protein [uncultured bacterium Contigcl_24]
MIAENNYITYQISCIAFSGITLAFLAGGDYDSWKEKKRQGGIAVESGTRTALRVSYVTMGINFILSAMKLTAGILAHSGAMVSDAVHSASDVFSTVIVIIGMRAAGKASDREHPYGHERLECVAAIILAGALLATGLMIGYQGVQNILHADTEPLPVPGALALIAAAVSIAVKEGMFRYTRAAAKQVRSDALMADAWHHRSDALSSIGALIGIGGAMLGLPILDPIASLVICLMIVKAAYDIFRDAVDKMVDRSCDEETEKAIRDTAMSHPDVLHIDRMMTRQFGNRIYIEMEISVDENMPLRKAHDVAEEVHDEIEKAFPQVKHIMIHVNPSGDHT